MKLAEIVSKIQLKYFEHYISNIMTDQIALEIDREIIDMFDYKPPR